MFIFGKYKVKTMTSPSLMTLGTHPVIVQSINKANSN